MIQLKMYGMNVIRPNLDNTSKPKEKKEDQLPSTLDDVDSFLEKATSEQPSRITMSTPSIPGVSEAGLTLRKENEPYNTVCPCDIDEIAPQKGEVGFTFLFI